MVVALRTDDDLHSCSFLLLADDRRDLSFWANVCRVAVALVDRRSHADHERFGLDLLGPVFGSAWTCAEKTNEEKRLRVQVEPPRRAGPRCVALR